jgi:hypothetical protein
MACRAGAGGEGGRPGSSGLSLIDALEDRDWAASQARHVDTFSDEIDCAQLLMALLKKSIPIEGNTKNPGKGLIVLRGKDCSGQCQQVGNQFPGSRQGGDPSFLLRPQALQPLPPLPLRPGLSSGGDVRRKGSVSGPDELCRPGVRDAHVIRGGVERPVLKEQLALPVR